jgi:hypothetical protein
LARIVVDDLVRLVEQLLDAALPIALDVDAHARATLELALQRAPRQLLDRLQRLAPPSDERAGVAVDDLHDQPRRRGCGC